MKKHIIILLTFTFSNGFAQIDTVFKNFKIADSEYIANGLPKEEPLVFLPHLLDAKVHHLHSTPVFSPSGDEMFFTAYINNKMPQIIFQCKRIEGKWQKPSVATFSGKYQDGRTVFSPDGNKFYFYSKRPVSDEDSISKYPNIWMSTKQDSAWSDPKMVEMPDSIGLGFRPSHYSKDGAFYFEVIVTERDPEVYQCKLINDIPTNIKKLNSNINITGKIEGAAITSICEKYLIFDTYERNKGDKSKIYISKRQENGDWGKAKKVTKIGKTEVTRFPGFTFDGKYFFFTSYQNGFEQIYWVEAKYLYELID